MTRFLGRVLVKSHHRYTVDHPKACSDSSVCCWRCENADQSPGMLFPNQQTSQRWIYYCNMRMQESRYLLLNCSLHFFICFSFLAPKATSHPTHDDSLSTKYSDVSKHIFVNFYKNSWNYVIRNVYNFASRFVSSAQNMTNDDVLLHTSLFILVLLERNPFEFAPVKIPWGLIFFLKKSLFDCLSTSLKRLPLSKHQK